MPSATQIRPWASTSILVGLKSIGEVAQSVTSRPSGTFSIEGSTESGFTAFSSNCG